MNNGWIKLHRKSMESSVWHNPTVWWVWCWCLMKASHTKHKFPFNNKDIDVEEGEFITGIMKACEELKLTTQKYRTAIKYLENTKRITIKTTNKFSLIKVNKWVDYQCDNKQTNKPITNQQQTNNKPITTYNKDKNEKNEKNIYDYGKKFETLTYNQKGDVFNMIKQYKINTGEAPKQGNIDIMVEKVLTV